MLHDASASVRATTVEVLLKVGSRTATRMLVRAMEGWPVGDLARLKALIAGMGNAAAPALLEALQDKQFGARVDALDVLVVIGGPNMFDIVRFALDDSDSRVRRRAAEQLGAMGNTAAVPILVGHLADVDADVRITVIRSLAGLGDKSAIDGIADRLSRDVPAVRIAAVNALAVLALPVRAPAGRRAIEALQFAATRDPSDAVRQAALQALQQLGVPVSPRRREEQAQ